MQRPFPGYTSIDRILFGDVTSCGLMKFLAGLWKAWTTLQRHVLLDTRGVPLPTYWRVGDIIKSLHPFSVLDDKTIVALLSIMSKLGVMRVQGFWESFTQEAKDFEEKLRRIWGLTPALETLARQLINATQMAARTCGKISPNLDNWF